MKVKAGSLWWSGDSRKFRVISVANIEGKDWVHYREDLGPKFPREQCKEFSCYLESFVERFSELPE